MNARIVLGGKLEYLGQAINRAETRVADRCDNRPDVTGLQQFFDLGKVHPTVMANRNRREWHSEDFTDAAVCVVSLLRGNDPFAGVQSPGNPQCLEIGHGAATGQVAEWRIPAVHSSKVDDAFFLERRTRFATVKRVIIGVNPK